VQTLPSGVSLLDVDGIATSTPFSFLRLELLIHAAFLCVD
jgi:hypothetical protein